MHEAATAINARQDRRTGVSSLLWKKPTESLREDP
jgi:hypothetical protein